MSEPIIYLVGSAPKGPAILEVLRDWSAVGLLQPFVWIAAADIHDGPARVPATLVVGGAAMGTTATDHIADVGRPSVVRICALDTLAGEPVQAAAAALSHRLVPAAPEARFLRAHLMLPTLGEDDAARPVPSEGWHNLVLAPEDADSPASARVLVSASDDSATIAMHHAAGIAGLLGLWSAAPECPLDDRIPLPGSQVQLMRSYLRHHDASQVEVSLRNAVLDIVAASPQPLRDGQPLPYVTNDQEAVGQTAEAFFAVHREFGRSPRVQPRLPPTEKRGLRESLKALFAFIGKAIIGAPKEFINRTIEKAATKLARAGQNLVYGDDSAYEIVVRGRLPNGRLASWAELDEASAELSKSLGAPDGHREQVTDIGAAWKDFVEVGLTLVDGRQRVGGVPQPQAGSSAAVVRNPSSVAPPPDEAFRGLPQHLAAQLGVETILSADLQRTADVLTELEIQAEQSVLTLEMSRARDTLDGWRREVQLPSFSGRVGLRLQSTIQDLRKEIDGYHAELAGYGNTELVDSAFAERAERRSKITRWILAALLMLIIGLGIAAAVEWLVWTRALLFGCSALAIGLGSVVVIFVSGQRDLYQLLHKRQTELARAQAAQQNLGAALSDLKKIMTAYRQYTHWATVLGAFLSQPFGPAAPAPGQVRLISGDLPRAMRYGVATLVAHDLETVVADLRRASFQTGWLQGPYHSLLSDIEEYVGTAGLEVRGRPERLYADTAFAAESPLRRLSNELVSTGVHRTGGDVFWSQTKTLLEQMPQIRSQLLSHVRWAGSRTTDSARGIDDFRRAGQPFDSSVMKPEHRVGEGLSVVEPDSRPFMRVSGLSETIVLTQFGTPFHPGLLAMHTDASSLPTPPADDWDAGEGPRT